MLTDRYLDGKIPAGSRASKAGTFLKPEMITDTVLQRVARCR